MNLKMYIDSLCGKYFDTGFKSGEKHWLIKVDYNSIYEMELSEKYMDEYLLESGLEFFSIDEISHILSLVYSVEESAGFDYLGLLVIDLEEAKTLKRDKLKQIQDDKYKKQVDLKLLEIDAINKNTEMQKYLAETVLGAMTYFAQMLKNKEVE